MSEVKIKKAFQPIISVLAANMTATVEDIFEEVQALAAAKTGGGTAGPKALRTAIKDVNGNVVAVQCYYFKRWMPLVGDEAVEFGAKKGTATGLNSMCKEGVKHWTAQQSAFKKATANILVEVEEGILDPADISARRAELEAAKNEIAETTLGFETIEEVREYLLDNGVELADAE